MPLFQSAVLAKYLKQQDSTRVAAAYAAFITYFHDPERQANIREAKEEQFQEGFLRELFVQVLGYTLNPDPQYELTTEFKNEKGGRKADGAVLVHGKALAVIELKGTDTTDLASINRQAFDYKANHSECVYVVTSNFQKLRFFIDNAVEHLEFDLFTLTSEQFSLLWLCLQRDNLLGGLPRKVKTESTQQEEKVTKDLYRDYSAFKTALWQDLVRNHPEQDKLALFKRTQKLLDRFLFILFSEDKGLLPPNSVKQIIEQWEKLRDLDEYRPLYERFKKYFHYLDVGRKGHGEEIFAYNGGLFRTDEALDALVIGDDLLRTHLATLARYYYESEVDVNILGHIFEHSLNEIEAITAELEGRAVDTKKTKRKKDGVFYTPKYITKYIVENTVGRLCAEKKDELGIDDEEYARGRKGRQKKTIEALDTRLDVYRDWLLSLTICDPACGSGAFLNQALDFLINEHRYVSELESKLLGQSIVFKDIGDHILERNIFGVDINEESVEIARLSLWLRTASKGRKLNDLSGNIKCGNSLIDDPAVAGAKAFDWKKEFPQVFAKGGFDVVVGNPPYVRVQNLVSTEVDFYFDTYQAPSGKLDISILFFELALRITSEGLCSFISSSQWMQTDYGQNIRKILSGDRIIEVVDFGSLPVFDDASTYPAIFLFSNAKSTQARFKRITEKVQLDNESIRLVEPKEMAMSDLSSSSWSISDFDLDAHIVSKKVAHKTLKSIAPAFIGTLTGMDKAFVVTNEQVRQHGLEEELLLPYAYRGEEVERFALVEPEARIIYPYREGVDGKSELLPESLLISEYPKIHAYLLNFRSELEQRLDSRKLYAKGADWYRFLRQGTYDYINPPKLIFKGIAYRAHVGKLNRHTAFNGANCPAVIPAKDCPVSIDYLLAVLNSSLIGFYLNQVCPKKLGGYFRYNAKNISNAPIALAKDRTVSLQLEAIGASATKLGTECSSILQSFTDHLRSKYALPKLSRALENWPSLEPGGFLKELRKAKVSLSLAEEAEWLGYFNAEKAKAQALQAQIDKTDAAIDALVYRLYGLTEAEIAVVEG